MVIKVCITIIAFVVTINNGQIGLFREVYRRRPLYKILGILVFSFVASPILCYFCPKPFSLRIAGGFQSLTLRRGQRKIRETKRGKGEYVLFFFRKRCNRQI